ncbi:MAG TPA: thioredoxin domain-containing protein [Candidatus Paceibacterota bacterium]
MKTNRGALSIASAIIIAGALIACAIIWINRPAATGVSALRTDSAGPDGLSLVDDVPPVTADDHILGNPNAPIKLVEYSDLSCPYCREMNAAMVQIMNLYGPTGKVAWVYRSLPLLMKPIDASGTIPHPNSGTQAEALECVAQLGGNSAFFSFEKQWFSTFPDGAETRGATIDRAVIDSLVRKIGVDFSSFNDCMSARRYEKKISLAYDKGLAAGITGTPTTYIFTPLGNRIELIGLQSYATLRNTIETLLPSIGTTTPGIKN